VAANETDPLVGALLGNSYRIERGIARGGMGRLYQAAHTRLPRRVAVKVLHEPHAQKKDAVRRFEREASALARIDSPHVVPVLDFVRTPDGRGAIVTPLLDGEDLQSRLERDGVVPTDEAVRIALEMCRGLAAAHAEGIVHRDLKPSNVFLARRPEGHGPPVVKLLDFGVAKLGEEDMTRTGVVLGTPAYMAPEQASGSASVDVRADVYGVGAVLYRMLAGRMPYEGEDAAHVLKRLLAAAPRRPSHHRPVPEAVEAVVQRAMARHPDERFPSARALGEALERLAPRTGSGAPERSSALSTAPSLLEERGAGLVIVAGAALASSAAVVGLARSTADALGASSDSARAFVTALALVGSLASLGGVGWALGRDLAARWESAPALAAFRRRWGIATGTGLATLGAAQLALLAASESAPGAQAGAVAVSAAVGALLPLRRRAPGST
jgi:serine/threonine-protein kinase